MRSFVIVFALLTFVPLAIFAGPPAKTELSIGGEFIQTHAEGEKNPWTFASSMYFPWGKGGHIVGGPAIAIGSDDELSRLGGGVDWNFMGQKSVSLFIGAQAFYFLKDVDGLDRYTALGLGGFKINVTQNAAIKIFALDVIDGRGKDETDLSANISALIKF